MRHPCFVLATIMGVAAGGAVFAEDWPSFRGARHDGKSTETDLKLAWSGKPEIAWKRDVGASFSAVAVVGDRAYTCGTKDGQQVLYCLNAENGEIIWQTPFEREYQERQGGDGTRATPTIDSGRVYVLGARGKLLCANGADGKEIWSKQFNHMPQWGYSGSVLVDGELAVTSGGKEDGALVAFKKATGEEVWKTGNDSAGYATPYPFDFEGTRYICGFTGNSAIIVEAATGRQVWHTEWKTDWDVNAAAPIFKDGHLFIGSGYRTGCALFKLSKNGDVLKGEEVWRKKVMMPKFQSCVLHEGKLYVSDQKALVCADFLTGKEEWRRNRLTNGTIAFAEGKLILLTESGELHIAPADPKAYQPSSEAKVFDKLCWTVPVIANGRMFIRDTDTVKCIKLR